MAIKHIFLTGYFGVGCNGKRKSKSISATESKPLKVTCCIYSRCFGMNIEYATL